MHQKKYSFVFMGVSGSGKSAVAKSIAKKMDVPFLDGDFLHPRSNIDKMAAGYPLTDEDREPWLEAINSAIYAMQQTDGGISILVCSALKRKYRDTLGRGNSGLYFIYLKGEFELISRRLQNRKDHFFKPEMLRSQFQILEEPLNNNNDTCVIDITKPLDEVVNDSISFIEKIVVPK